MKKSNPYLVLLRHILISLGVSAVMAFGLFFLFAFIITKQMLPSGTYAFFSLFALATSAFFGGALLAYFQKRHGLLFGGLIGVIFVLIIAFNSFCNSAQVFSFVVFARAILLLLSGAMGGYIGILKREKRKKHHRV